MAYKTVIKTVTPQGLGVEGDTTGAYILNLQKKLPVQPVNLRLSDGKGLFIGSSKIEIKLPKNKELQPDTIDAILTEGAKALLEENRNREPSERERIKITLSLGDDTVYFSNGHLDKDDAGNPMPMNPIMDRKDETVLRILDSNFTNDINDLWSMLRRQHNETQKKGEDQTPEIAEKLGFVTVEKADSIIEVPINGVTDTCTVTRLCIHANEFQNDDDVLKSVVDTHRCIRELGINPLILLRLSNSIDITIGRDKKTISIEQGESTPRIQKLTEAVLNLLVTKDAIKNVPIEYEAKVYVEEKKTEQKPIKEESLLSKLIATISAFRKNHGHQFVLGLTLASIPVLFAIFLSANQNSYFQAAMAIIPPVVLAVAIVAAGREDKSWARAFGQKRFLAYIWFFNAIAQGLIGYFGFDWYLKGLISVVLGVIVVVVGLLVIYYVIKAIIYVVRKLSPPTKRLFGYLGRGLKALLTPVAQLVWYLLNTLLFKPIGWLLTLLTPYVSRIVNRAKNSKAKEKVSAKLESKPVKAVWFLLLLAGKISLALIGIAVLIIYVVAFLPMFILVFFMNMGRKSYWDEYRKYRTEIIETAIHKYRDQRKLAPTCRVIFTPTKCKKLKNPLMGMGVALRKKLPKLLTADGFVGSVEWWLTGYW